LFLILKISLVVEIQVFDNLNLIIR